MTDRDRILAETLRDIHDAVVRKIESRTEVVKQNFLETLMISIDAALECGVTLPNLRQIVNSYLDAKEGPKVPRPDETCVHCGLTELEHETEDDDHDFDNERK